MFWRFKWFSSLLPQVIINLTPWHFYPHFGSRWSHILHALDASDAIMRDFTAGSFYIIPETARTLIAKPSCLTWEKKRRKQGVLQAWICFHAALNCKDAQSNLALIIQMARGEQSNGFVTQKWHWGDINCALIGLKFLLVAVRSGTNVKQRPQILVFSRHVWFSVYKGKWDSHHDLIWFKLMSHCNFCILGSPNGLVV